MASRDQIDQFKRILESMPEWPPKREAKILHDLYLYQALRESDHAFLKPADWREGRPYLIDPLAERIATAKADLIFGAEPDFTAAKDKDQALLEQLIEGNMVPSELQGAAEMAVSEGETWWRCYIDKELADVPILDFHSRTVTYPYLRGKRIRAVAFITVIQDGDDAWRQVEMHATGLVANFLYKVPLNQARGETATRGVGQTQGGARPFGEQVNLDQRPETEDLAEEWVHDLDSMLAGRVINKRGRKPWVGVSDYHGKVDLLLELNEVQTVGRENMKLTAKKRVQIDQSLLSPGTLVTGNGQQITLPEPEFDSSEDVFVSEQLDEELGGGTGRVPFNVIEYSFEAEPLIAWKGDLEDTILIRCRVAPQLVGKHTEQAQTGPALRARLLDSILDSQGKARYWDDETPRALQACQMVDALPQALGGFARGWQDATDAPAMKRKSALPEDETEEITNHVASLNAGLESQKTAIGALHPEWDEGRIQQEIDDINGPAPQQPAPPPPPPPGG